METLEDLAALAVAAGWARLQMRLGVQVQPCRVILGRLGRILVLHGLRVAVAVVAVQAERVLTV
jgi:hypothetical protein